MKARQSILMMLVVTSSLSVIAAKKSVQTVFPVKNYAEVEIGRRSRKAYVTLKPKEQKAAQYRAKSQAILACDQAAIKYGATYLPPSPNRKYDKEFEFSQNPSTKISPIFIRVTEEITESLPLPNGTFAQFYSMSFIFQCNGRWIDTNSGRFN